MSKNTPTKQEKKMQEMKEAQRKKLKKLLEFPFCRGCRKELSKERQDVIMEKVMLPLCEECEGPMMEKYKENIRKFQELFSQ